MKRILKYTIGTPDSKDIHTVDRNAPFTIAMVIDAEILAVQMQPILPPIEFQFGAAIGPGRIWVLVDPAEIRKEYRTFRIMETGQEIDTEKWTYIETYQVFGGEIVLHLFEKSKAFAEFEKGRADAE